MTATSQQRGHKLMYVSSIGWVYADTGGSAFVERPCILCGKMPVDGHDVCIASKADVSNACCGHGVTTGYSK